MQSNCKMMPPQAADDASPLRYEMMLRHFVPKRGNVCSPVPKARIISEATIAEGDIICPTGQTSFKKTPFVGR